MSWHGIEGQDAVFEQFQRSLTRGRLASTFLFVGPAGIGKRATALAIAKALLCENSPDDSLTACCHCPACVQVDALSHPDLRIVNRPADRVEIPVRTFIGPPENRLREGLCYDLSLKPFRGGRKIAIIDDADYLNEEGANCLLKTLEEPPPRSLLILIGTSAQRQLPTIRSRCQIVRFRPLDEPTLTRLILAQEIATTTAEAEQLARMSEGSLQRGHEYVDPALRDFRIGWLNDLATGDFWSAESLKEIGGFVEAAGTDAPARRTRLRVIIGFSLQFYDRLLHAIAGHPVVGDDHLVQSVERARRNWPAGAEGIVRCMDCSLDALAQLDASAHINSVIDCWFDEISAASTEV